MRRADVAHGLAWAAAAGEWEHAAIAARIADALGREEAAWMRSLARGLVAAFPETPIDLDGLGARIAAHRSFDRAIAREPLTVRHWLVPRARMGEPRFGVPSLASHADVAELLDVPLAALDWLADVRGMNRRAREPKLHHYVYRWIAKRTGGHRLIEAPKPMLRHRNARSSTASSRASRIIQPRAASSAVAP